MLTPVAGNSRVPLGVATPYASMLLEARQGEVALVPASAFRAGLTPTDADLQRFYAENKARYTVPEQRVLRIAAIGPDQVAAVAATDQEIAAYYNANQAIYGGRDLRDTEPGGGPGSQERRRHRRPRARRSELCRRDGARRLSAATSRSAANP